ncbi:hypothetical protein ACQ4M4_15490 [Leptolyngbya sp. AN02str]|uniref:hypothetical protein n=1 Tax=Leptolyngbya sp. AN02str TaxID=3423363 RepID=UPI003D31C3C8
MRWFVVQHAKKGTTSSKSVLHRERWRGDRPQSTACRMAVHGFCGMSVETLCAAADQATFLKAFGHMIWLHDSVSFGLMMKCSGSRAGLWERATLGLSLTVS